MAVHSPSRKLTYDDFVRFPDDFLRHEILDGVHVVTPAPILFHQDIVGNLYVAIRQHLQRQPGGKVFISPVGVRLSEHDVVQPDVFFVSQARLEILHESYAMGAPDLVIEALSPSTRRRDLGLKRERYERTGVAEYWVVDPKARTVTVFRRRDGAFLPPEVLSAEAGDRLQSGLLPGLEIPLAEIFRA